MSALKQRTMAGMKRLSSGVGGSPASSTSSRGSRRSSHPLLDDEGSGQEEDGTVLVEPTPAD
jgi:hypothetical protein